MFLPDLKAGLSNIYRSLMEGGQFAAAVWASPDHDTLIASTMDIVMKETNSKPPPLGTPGPFSQKKDEILKTVTEAARKYTNNNAGKVRFENKSILIVGKNEYQ